MRASAAGEPAYNYYLHTGPARSGELPHYHWHLELTPRTARPAGFEWGSGCFINAVLPESARGRAGTSESVRCSFTVCALAIAATDTDSISATRWILREGAALDGGADTRAAADVRYIISISLGLLVNSSRGGKSEAACPPLHLVGGDGRECGVVALAGANPDDLFQRLHEDFSVAHFAGARG